MLIIFVMRASTHGEAAYLWQADEALSNIK